MTVHQGGCLCGNLRYAVDAGPVRTTYCHCKFCQRATGGAYMVEPIFNSSDFRMTQGVPKVYSQTSAGSGKQVYVHFCDTCGTKLFLTFERFDGITGVYGGTFDDTDWFERTGDTTKHIFLGVAQKGTVIPAGINTFEVHAVLNDGTPVVPVVYKEPRQI